MPSALLHHPDRGGGALQLLVRGSLTSWLGPTSDGLGNGIVGVYSAGQLLGQFVTAGSGIQSSASLILRGGAFSGAADWTARLADHSGFFIEDSILYSHHMGRLHLRAVRLGGDTKNIVRLGYQDGDPFVGELRLYDLDGEKVIMRPRARSGWIALYGVDEEGELRQVVNVGGEVESPRRGRLYLYDAGSQRVWLGVDDSGRGGMSLRDGSGQQRVRAGADAEGAYLELRDGAQFVRIRTTRFERPPGKEGPLDQFVAQDPDDPTRTIHYCVLEGPEVGMYVRGTARLSRGKATVHLPGHFSRLASEQGLTAHLTPRSARSRGVAAVSLSRSRLAIREMGRGRGSYEVDYLVHGVRRGMEGFQPVRASERDEARLQPGGRPCEARDGSLPGAEAGSGHAGT